MRILNSDESSRGFLAVARLRDVRSASMLWETTAKDAAVSACQERWSLNRLDFVYLRICGGTTGKRQ